MVDTDPVKILAPLQLAARQKRLRYWRSIFTPEALPPAEKTNIKESLSTYELLLAKLSRSGTEAELEESRARLLKLERELAELFEQKRYATSKLAIRNAPEIKILKPRA